MSKQCLEEILNLFSVWLKNQTETATGGIL